MKSHKKLCLKHLKPVAIRFPTGGLLSNRIKPNVVIAGSYKAERARSEFTEISDVLPGFKQHLA